MLGSLKLSMTASVSVLLAALLQLVAFSVDV
jgi:hypothetical protein